MVEAGRAVPFVLTWFPRTEPPPDSFDAVAPRSRTTERWWREWSRRCTLRGRLEDEVLRSLIVLKALTYAPTGGIVAAPTTSLPE